ncbi:MAG: thermonuclease family protein [Allosphingosinicella sp.]|uniref:thermonuclease family protein n=1 Tax=Allosphingosinicella sp. TaxID=2823234 RepID=UPI00394DF28A
MNGRKRRLRRQLWRSGLVAGGLTAILAAGSIRSWVAPAAETAPTFTCTATRVHDGDGPIWCREHGNDARPIKVRLAGIAARELDESCSDGHPCPAASGAAARQSLERLALGLALRCEQVGTSYGRIVAFCRTPDGVDLSCAQIRAGVALRWVRHDPQGRLARC